MSRHETVSRLLSVTEVADTIGLSETAIYRAIAAGELRASKLRGRLRVQLADLEQWIEANRVRPVTSDRSTRQATGRPPARSRVGGLRELLRQET